MKQKQMADSELAIMKLLWEHDGLTARQMREWLYPDSTKAQHGTIQRLLQRLEDKGFVERDRETPVHVFSAVISRKDYAGGQLDLLANKLADNSFELLMTHLVEKKQVTRENINKIHAMIDEFEEE